SASTAEDTVLTSSVDLDANDTDLDGDSLSVVAGTFTTSEGGTIVIASDGSYTYTPAANFTGTDTVDYTVTDGSLTDVGTLTISVTSVNDVPVAVDDVIVVSADTTYLNGDVSSNDTQSPDGNNLYGVSSAPTNGVLNFNPDGSFTYTPNSGYTGQDSFEYTITDADGDISTATVSILVPDLNDNSAQVYEEALESGSNSSSNAEVVSGNLLSDDSNLPDNLSLSVFIAGGNVNNSVAGQTTITTADGNVLQVNTDSSSSGFGDYTYTLVNPVDHNLAEHNFDTGGEGWMNEGGASLYNGQLLLNRDGTASRAYSFGAGMAGAEIVISFDLYVDGGWETSGGGQDYLEVVANGSQVGAVSPVDESTTRVSVTTTLDGNGDLALSLTADTTANNEYALIDSIVISAVEQVDRFTYTLSDGNQFSDSASLDVAIVNDRTDVPRDRDESIDLTENQDISLGDFNLLDNTGPQSGVGSVTAVTGGGIRINGADASSDFTFTQESNGSGEIAHFMITHNETLQSAELVVYANGNVTFINEEEHLFDFLGADDNAELFIDYTVNTSGENFSSTATLNIAGVNDAPVAEPDSGLTRGGFASEFWVYNEGVDGPNLESVAQVIGFTGRESPDATFVSTGFNYSTRSGDSDYRANLGTGSNLESWLADGGDEASVVRNTTESRGDAIVRFAGVFDVDTAGTYTLNITHDDGFVIFIDGVQTFTADFITSPSNFVETTELTAGRHEVEVYYWDQGGEYVFDGSLYGPSGQDVWAPSNVSYRGAPHTTNEDQPITINVLANDYDIDGDSLNVSAVSNGANGTVTTNGNTVTYSPNPGFFGQDSFTYTVTDGNGGYDSIRVPVEVRPENNAPELDLDSDDSTATGNAYQAYGQLNTQVAITDSDLSISDTDASTLLSARVEIRNAQAGDQLSINGSLPSGISFSYDSANFVATLTGNASHAAYQQALSMMTLNGSVASSTARELAITVSDGLDVSDEAISTIIISDDIYGTAGDDVIDDSSGYPLWLANTIYGLEGDDTIYGQSDSDQIYGGAGEDTLYGGSQNDQLFGGDDNDTLYGESGNDELHGGSGDDILEGQANEDTLYGGDGDDTLSGGSEMDSLYGGAGDDTLYGGNNSDVLVGGAGNDVLYGGSENWGGDIFEWSLADVGASGQPAEDVVADFNVNLTGETLDLTDLLSNGLAGGDLSSYMNFSEGASGELVIHISSQGNLGSDNYTQQDQQITLSGVNYVSTEAVDIMSSLLANGYYSVE
ncbi:tandem-95 repeat protein, partial [Gilvimarinus chinensis]|uniref:tandem-95 repeat protein n=1 Tax=Gilvimarinus chinensis TaxID=396005 RepID=UPI000594C7C8